MKSSSGGVPGISYFLFSAFSFAISLAAESAQAVSVPPPTRYTEIKPLIEAGLQWLLSIAGPLALLILIYGGIVYMTSAGRPEKAEQGKRIVTWTLFGLIVVLMSYAVVQVIENIFIGE
jgi:hypothetical protein